MDEFRIREQLALLSDRIPTTYFMGVITVDGLGVTFPKHEKASRIYREQDRVAPTSVAMMALGERFISELGGGEYKSSVFKGENGTIFNIVLDEEHVLSIGVREVKSIDAIFIILQHEWGELLRLLSISAPEL